MCTVEPKNVTITFDTDGGTQIADKVVQKGALVNIPANPTKENSEFIGWYYDDTLTESVTWPITARENITLYAGWVLEGTQLYTITFNTNGGSDVESITNYAGTYISRPANPTKEEDTFIGWYYEVTLENLIEWPHLLEEDINMYAKWDNENNEPERTNASYYEPGVPLIDDAHVIYINLDGFGKYYYDAMIDELGDNSVLKQLMTEGTFFSDLRTTYPSITNPCQNMILTGATSKYTGNVYRYYDKAVNTVISQGRESFAPRLTKLTKDAGIPSASIAQYLAGEDLYLSSESSKDSLYINVDNTNPKVVERGSARYGDYFARFEQLIKLVKGEPIKVASGGTTVTLTELPKFTLLYCDDLDALGHNEVESNYGVARATSEEQRLANCVNQLKGIDAKLGELISVCKVEGIYDRITFFLTSDHGMQGFGRTSNTDVSSGYGMSKLTSLKNALASVDPTYNLELVAPGNNPSSQTTVVGVGANLNLALSFKNGVTDEKLEEIKTHLEQQNYVYRAFTRKELEKMGVWGGANIDLLVTPSGRHCFSNSPLSIYTVRGQHDSFQDDANNVYGLIWGKGIKKGLVYDGEAYNYDFGVLMAASLGVIIPNPSGVVLDIFER